MFELLAHDHFAPERPAQRDLFLDEVEHRGGLLGGDALARQAGLDETVDLFIGAGRRPRPLLHVDLRRAATYAITLTGPLRVRLLPATRHGPCDAVTSAARSPLLLESMCQVSSRVHMSC
ncbi:hypothetical protein IGB19_24125 [Streptomyces sp. AC04842]|nr:hypothetical protein [Streptomyces sp. AC04842]